MEETVDVMKERKLYILDLAKKNWQERDEAAPGSLCDNAVRGSSTRKEPSCDNFSPSYIKRTTELTKPQQKNKYFFFIKGQEIELIQVYAVQTSWNSQMTEL